MDSCQAGNEAEMGILTNKEPKSTIKYSFPLPASEETKRFGGKRSIGGKENRRGKHREG